MEKRIRISGKTGLSVICASTLIFGILTPVFSAEAAGIRKLAGNYICFEEQEGEVHAVLKKGILTLEDGRIAEIAEDTGETEGVTRLDDECVIYPGLLDLHSHVEYNSFQLWESDENEVPWDNRFEWRRSAQERADLADKYKLLEERWGEPLEKGSDCTVGDLIEYFAEAQAAAGGTTLIQGYNQTEEYTTADSHEKIRLIRDTCSAEDLGVEPGEEITCLIQIFKPDAEILTEEPETYLPPIDTSGWDTVEQIDSVTERTCLEELLESIGNKTACGYLIHLAEGRSGVRGGHMDPFCELEFQTFKNAIESGIEAGDFTAEDVRNAHIGLIHACGADLRDEETCEFIRDCGIGLLWAPVSNLMLYADTPVFYNYFGDDEILAGIGSDWSPSGSKTVWDECKFGLTYMQKFADDPWNARENLLRACTWNAAKIIGNPKMGNIAEGCFADLFILRGDEAVSGDVEKALEMFTESDDGDVEGVIVGGESVYGEQAFLRTFEGEERMSSYGTVDSGEEALSGKQFLLPEVFGSLSFEEAYRKYEAILADTGIEMSRLRRMEDPFYQEFIERLKEEFCA